MRVIPDGSTDSPNAWAALEALAKERSGALAFDVGANTGQASRLLASYFGTVMAYEPHPDSYAELSRSVPAAIVVPRQLAVSRHPGEVKLDVASESDTTGQYVSWGAHEGHPEWGERLTGRLVPCTTVGTEVSRTGQLPALVKIDTEGHEAEVLAGAKHVIGLGFSSWFIEVHSAELGEEVRGAFPKRRYAITVIEHEWLDEDLGQDHFYLVARPEV